MNLEQATPQGEQKKNNIFKEEFPLQSAEDVRTGNLEHYKKLKAAQAEGTPAVRQALIEILRDNPVEKLPDTDIIFWRDFLLARLEIALKRDGVQY